MKSKGEREREEVVVEEEEEKEEERGVGATNQLETNWLEGPYWTKDMMVRLISRSV